MAFDFSTLITDRSPEDLQALRDMLAVPMSDWTAEQLAEFNQAVSKGAYNYTDLNRVTACMDYLNERLTALGYETGYHPIIVHPETPPPTPTLPEGYTELEYIESSGNQYIDTGYIPDYTMGLEMSVEFLPGENAALFGARDYANQSDPKSNTLFSISDGKLRSDYYGSGQTSQSVFRGKLQVQRAKNVTVINDSETLNNSESSTGSSAPYSLFLLCANTGGVAGLFLPAKLYRCSITNSSGDVRTYVSCKSPSGEAGLYDLAHAQFYGNAGSGSFTAGPEVPTPEPEPTLDPYTWYEGDIPTASQMQRYLANVAALRGVLELPEDTVALPADLTGLTQEEANTIEDILGTINTYLLALQSILRRCGAVVCGGPELYFVN